MKPPQRLFIPGPTDVVPEVLDAQTSPMIGHRSDEFEALFESIQAQLRRLFMTDQRVYVLAASGSGLLEAAIRNTVGERVLCVVCGAFGRRWLQVAEACGKRAIPLDIEWNKGARPEQVGNALRNALAEGPIDAVTVTHNETSTGVMNPVAEITQVIHDISPETLVLVDAVSSFSATPIPFDDWNLDVCLTSSQKAMALPPGLALCAVRDRVLVRAAGIAGRGWYFDFINLEKALMRNTTPATPAISLMRALDVQLDRIFKEGLAERYTRHASLAEMVREWAERNGYELAAEAGFRSPTVTHICNTQKLDISDMNRFLGKRGMVVSDGYGPFRGKAFRIAHMGEATAEDMSRLLEALDDYLAETSGVG